MFPTFVSGTYLGNDICVDAKFYKTKIIMKKFIYLLAFVILSCGARKTQKTETKVTAEIEKSIIDLKKDSLKIAQTENVSQATSSTETQKTDETSLVFTPIDSTKSIEITDSNGKVLKVKNAKVHRQTKKIDIQKNEVQNIDTEKTTNLTATTNDSQKTTTKIKAASSTANQNTDRKNVMDMFWLIIALAVCIAVLLYWSAKKDT